MIHHMVAPDPEPKSPRATDIRLPTALNPVNYVVKLQPFINGNFSIMGSVEIEIEVLEATSNITLHILDIITINDSVKVSYEKYRESNGKNSRFLLHRLVHFPGSIQCLLYALHN